MVNKILVWGAMPWEQDGGAVVTYYQFQEMNYINPLFEIHAIPKIWDQASSSSLPMVKMHRVRTKYFGQIPKKEIVNIMKNNGISTLILWHIPWEYFPIIDEVHKIGGKVINWQTIHWKNDMLFLSDKLKDFDWWVPPTEYAKRTLQEVAGLSNNLTVIPHGINTSLFFPHPVEYKSKLKTILFTGRCQLTKGIVPLMMIARKFVDRFNCRIIFKAGIHEGIYKSKEIAHLIKQMSNRDNRIVFIPQWISPSQHEDLVASSDIVVCPSGHEGFSLTPLEGMACKKPIVASDIPVHRELLGKNGECGLLLPTSVPTEYVNDTQLVTVPDSDMLYGALKYLIENPDEAEYMGDNGNLIANTVYNLTHVSKEWFKTLELLQ